MIVCDECGAPLTAGAAKRFCSRKCTKAWNNRRMLRGAELYDLWMALRYDRQTAAHYKVWKVLCRLSAIYREEDIAERAGRKSWRHPRTIIMKWPHIEAVTIVGPRRTKP